MYNRYIPQPDGSYRRNRIQEPAKAPQPSVESPQPKPVPPPASDPVPCSGCIHHTNNRRPQTNYQPRQNISVSGFLKQLLPKNFDVEDLLVILLLLLMSGDSQEDQNTALLTLALYLFL